MIVITETLAWIAEGDCPKCAKHDRIGVPQGVAAGQVVGMRCSACKQVYDITIPVKPTGTVTMNPKL